MFRRIATILAIATAITATEGAYAVLRRGSTTPLETSFLDYSLLIPRIVVVVPTVAYPIVYWLLNAHRIAYYKVLIDTCGIVAVAFLLTSVLDYYVIYPSDPEWQMGLGLDFILVYTMGLIASWTAITIETLVVNYANRFRRRQKSRVHDLGSDAD
jgi:hypothetical protein